MYKVRNRGDCFALETRSGIAVAGEDIPGEVGCEADEAGGDDERELLFPAVLKNSDEAGGCKPEEQSMENCFQVQAKAVSV